MGLLAGVPVCPTLLLPTDKELILLDQGELLSC